MSSIHPRRDGVDQARAAIEPLRFFVLGGLLALSLGLAAKAHADTPRFNNRIAASPANPPSLVPAVTVAPAAPASLTLLPEVDGPGASFYFAAPGTTVKIRLRAENVPPGPTALRWEALDFDGDTVGAGEPRLDATGGASFELVATRPGITYLRATLLDARHEVLARAEARFATVALKAAAPGAPRPEASLPVLYGANAHLDRHVADIDRQTGLMAALGFRACRCGQTWAGVQPAPEVWHWEVDDKIFGALERYGITPVPVLGYGASWATTGDATSKDWHQWNNTPPVTADFVGYAQALVKRYGHLTNHWEIWNEPDIDFWLGTPEQFAALYDATQRGIHDVQPDAQVMNGGFSETRRHPQFIPTWQARLRDKPAILAYHSHGPYANMVRAADDVARYLTTAGWTMPVWLNEAGFSSNRGLTERDQAINLVKKMSAAPALGFKAYFWYDLVNDGVDPNDAEHNFGLARADFTPKAAGVAAHTLMETLAGQRYVRQVAVPGNSSVTTLLFERPGGEGGTLVTWNEAAASVPLFWRLPGRAHTISMMGEISALTATEGLTAAAAGPEPRFLTFSGPASALRCLGSPLDFEPAILAAPGETVYAGRRQHGEPVRGHSDAGTAFSRRRRSQREALSGARAARVGYRGAGARRCIFAT